MKRSDKAVRGKFRSRRNGASGLPRGLVSLLDVERKKRMWRKRLSLWGGAVIIGLAIGIGPSLLRSSPTTSVDPQPNALVEAKPDDPTTDADREWAARARESADAAYNKWVAQADGRAPATSAVRSQFSLCFTGGGYNCVVDGDTIWLRGEKIRIADIDAPETHDPRCASEKELGDRATLRLQQLLDSGIVTLEPIDRDRDVYGRRLRLVLVDGRSVGDTLVNEGLARWYEGHRRPWC